MAQVLATYMALIFGISLISLVISTIAWWIIFTKAGYNGALSLLFFVPIAGIIMFFVFAFGEWPARRETALLRQQLVALQGQYVQSAQPHYPSGQQYQQYQQYPQYSQYPQGQRYY
jgi:hypothetical protein